MKKPRKPRMRVVSWTKGELRIFSKHYNKLELTRLKELLPGKTKYAIHDMAERKGWKIDAKKQDLDEKERQWLCKNWPEHGLGLAKCVRRLNVGVTVLRRVGKELGLKVCNPDKLFTEYETQLMSKLVEKRYSVRRIRDEFYYRSYPVLAPYIKKAAQGIDNAKLDPTVRKLKCI